MTRSLAMSAGWGTMLPGAIRVPNHGARGIRLESLPVEAISGHTCPGSNRKVPLWPTLGQS